MIADLDRATFSNIEHQAIEESNLANEWWKKFCSLSKMQLKELTAIVSMNHFENIISTDKSVLEVLEYYKIKRP